MPATIPIATQEQLDELIGKPRRRPRRTGMTTELWSRVHVMTVPVLACLPTQLVKAEWVNEYLAEHSRRSYSGDPFGHIVVQDGRWLISDGHHRWAAAVMAGHPWWVARVLVR